MVNHVGKTSTTLSSTLGEVTTFSSSESITLIAGELGAGSLLFDPIGTVGVISSFVSGNEFTVTTLALSINIQTILSAEY